MKEFYLDSCGGGRLHCAIWTPEGEPKAVVQLIHGIAEHIGRYDEFARFLNAHGYVVAADDHMGPGGSVENGVKGYFSGGWLSAVEDEKRLHDEIAAQYPALPYYILGHSMGSFLLRTYLYTYPDAVDKAVISGTGWEDPTKVRLGKLVCKLEQARVGETSTSKLVTKLMFGSCLFILSRFSGSKDPVGGMAKGVLRCIDAFKRSGMKDITIKLYPEGRHEMLNERNKAEVYQDILDWLER